MPPTWPFVGSSAETPSTYDRPQREGSEQDPSVNLPNNSRSAVMTAAPWSALLEERDANAREMKAYIFVIDILDTGILMQI